MTGRPLADLLLAGLCRSPAAWALGWTVTRAIPASDQPTTSTQPNPAPKWEIQCLTLRPPAAR